MNALFLIASVLVSPSFSSSPLRSCVTGLQLRLLASPVLSLLHVNPGACEVCSSYMLCALSPLGRAADARHESCNRSVGWALARDRAGAKPKDKPSICSSVLSTCYVLPTCAKLGRGGSAVTVSTLLHTHACVPPRAHAALTLPHLASLPARTLAPVLSRPTGEGARPAAYARAVRPRLRRSLAPLLLSRALYDNAARSGVVGGAPTPQLFAPPRGSLRPSRAFRHLPARGPSGGSRSPAMRLAPPSASVCGGFLCPALASRLVLTAPRRSPACFSCGVSHGRGLLVAPPPFFLCFPRRMAVPSLCPDRLGSAHTFLPPVFFPLPLHKAP